MVWCKETLKKYSFSNYTTPINNVFNNEVYWCSIYKIFSKKVNL